MLFGKDDLEKHLTEQEGITCAQTNNKKKNNGDRS